MVMVGDRVAVSVTVAAVLRGYTAACSWDEASGGGVHVVAGQLRCDVGGVARFESNLHTALSPTVARRRCQRLRSQQAPPCHTGSQASTISFIMRAWRWWLYWGGAVGVVVVALGWLCGRVSL